MRKYTDERGTAWCVFEMHSASLSEGSRHSLPEHWRAGWLVFESGTERWRLAPIPAQWIELPEATLHALRESGVRATTPSSGSAAITGEIPSGKSRG